jgi:hypothetical protein
MGPAGPQGQAAILDATGVGPGWYDSASINVDAYGRVTYAVEGMMGGDLIGTASNASVRALQGVVIAPIGPSQGEVLMYQNGMWRPGILGPNNLGLAGGDVSGPMNSMTVHAIQNIPVAAQAPRAGSALVFNGSVWQPTSVAGTGAPTESIALTKNSTAPAACTSSIDGEIVLTANYTMCVCRNGVGWVSTSDGATACAFSS